MRAVYACDVGGTRSGKFAWARVEPETGSGVTGSSDIRVLTAALERDLKQDYSIALGFEAPLYIPVPESSDDLSRGCTGEGSRAWAAPAGSTVAMLGVHQSAWLLRTIFRSCGRCALTLDWEAWPPTASEPVLFCWEAFVSAGAHGTSHVQDAATAAMEFLRYEYALAAANAVTASRPLSLIGAVALWSGWTSSLDVLHEPTLVIKPKEPYRGPIDLV